MNEVSSPQRDGFDPDSSNMLFQDTPPGVQRFHFTLPAGPVNLSKRNHTTFDTQPIPFDPTPTTQSHASNATPRRVEMRVVPVNPAHSEYNIEIFHPSMNSPRSIPFKRDPMNQPSNSNDTAASNSQQVHTSGALCFPCDLPIKVAVSGWSQSSITEHQLNNRYWTNRVFEMCNAIGHTLEGSQWDPQGQKGRYQASHVEKQLLAYVFFKHVFRRRDPPPREPRADEEIQWNQAMDCGDEMDWVQTFEDVSAEKTVLIYADQRPCGACKTFMRDFHRFTGIKVIVNGNGELWTTELKTSTHEH